jgi:hypothetical protein
MTGLPTYRLLDEADLRRLQAVSETALVADLQAVLTGLPLDTFPVALCCDRGGMIEPEGWSINLLSARRTGRVIHARLGFFFTEVVGGCNCHDDPIRYAEYRVLELTLDCLTGGLDWRASG